MVYGKVHACGAPLKRPRTARLRTRSRACYSRCRS
jgi:hypothetical protein